MSAFYAAVITQVGINVLLALGYWIAVSTGKYSFGHAAFMAIGAYASSILTLNFGWSLPVALVAGAVFAAVGGALVGWVALRLTMLYLAIITLVFSELLITLISQWDYVGGGSGLIGMSGTSVPLVLVFVILTVIYLVLLTRSRMGLAYAAIREDEQAAMGAGIKITLVSVGAFATSAAVTGIAGGLAAHQQLIINPTSTAHSSRCSSSCSASSAGCSTSGGRPSAQSSSASCRCTSPVWPTGTRSSTGCFSWCS